VASSARLASDKLNELFPPKESGDRRQRQTIVQRLNQDQAFRIVVQSPGVVYAEGRFYKPRIRWTLEGGAKPVLDFVFSAPSLSNVTSEKGERDYARHRDRWYTTSIFGLVGAVCDRQLGALGIRGDALTQALGNTPSGSAMMTQKKALISSASMMNTKSSSFCTLRQATRELTGPASTSPVSKKSAVRRLQVWRLSREESPQPYGRRSAGNLRYRLTP
jgi:hypothetical protein